MEVCDHSVCGGRCGDGVCREVAGKGVLGVAPLERPLPSLREARLIGPSQIAQRTLDDRGEGHAAATSHPLGDGNEVLIHGDREGLKQGLWATIILGAIFTAIQAYEYSIAPFNFGQNTYSSAFYMATGFHGFHVLIGTIFLIVCLIRAYAGHFTPRQHFGFEAAAWYWHFVDVVWLFLFVAIYIWGGWGAPVH